MITCVSGSRTVRDRELVYDLLDRTPWVPTRVNHGAAGGVDRLARSWARLNGIPESPWLPRWMASGGDAGKSVDKAAGLKRNALMVRASQAFVAIWHMPSRGTKHAIGCAKHGGIVRMVWQKAPQRDWMFQLSLPCHTGEHWVVGKPGKSEGLNIVTEVYEEHPYSPKAWGWDGEKKVFFRVTGKGSAYEKRIEINPDASAWLAADTPPYNEIGDPNGR